MPTPPEGKVTEATAIAPTAPTVPGTTETKVLVETKPAPFPAPVGAVEQKVTITQRTEPLKEFGRWGAGLLAGFIKGGTHAVTSGTIVTGYQAIKGANPFSDLRTLLTLYLALFIAHGVISMMFYLQAHPIPDEWNPSMTDRRAARP